MFLYRFSIFLSKVLVIFLGGEVLNLDRSLLEIN